MSCLCGNTLSYIRPATSNVCMWLLQNARSIAAANHSVAKNSLGPTSTFYGWWWTQSLWFRSNNSFKWKSSTRIMVIKLFRKTTKPKCVRWTWQRTNVMRKNATKRWKHQLKCWLAFVNVTTVDWIIEFHSILAALQHRTSWWSIIRWFVFIDSAIYFASATFIESPLCVPFQFYVM